MTRAAIHLRLATPSDVPELHRLIEQSVRHLQQHDYTPTQIEGALGHALGLDTQLVTDQTYFVAHPPAEPSTLVACGGWSFRKTLFGSDHGPAREAGKLDPATDAAKIRAIFVHPDWARQGLGSLMLTHCEQAAVAAGFSRFEMGSTLTGVPLYTLRGYRPIDRVEIALPNGSTLPIVRMAKTYNAVEVLAQ